LCVIARSRGATSLPVGPFPLTGRRTAVSRIATARASYGVLGQLDDRKVLNGIYWRLRTGSPWGDILECYGPPTTRSNQFRCWAKIGVWDRIFEAVSKAYDGDLQMIDASSIRVHQHGGNVQKGGRTPRLPRLGPRSSQVHGTFARRPDHGDPR
jgi:transposase